MQVLNNCENIFLTREPDEKIDNEGKRLKTSSLCGLEVHTYAGTPDADRKRVHR